MPQRNVVGVDHDLAYPQLLAGEIDAIDVYSTDAMIHRGDLAVLEDDLKFFPRYDAVWLYRQEAVDRYPQLLAAIRQLEGAISEPTMRKLNDLVESRRAVRVAGCRRFSSHAPRSERRGGANFVGKRWS